MTGLPFVGKGPCYRLGYQRAYCHLFADRRDQAVLPPMTATTRVLDCGIGTGALSLALATACPGLTQLDGVDLSAAMVQVAADNLAAAGVKLIGQQGNAEWLPFGNGEFDLVMAAHLLEHLPEPTRALTELLRVLKAGGVLLLLINQPTLWTQWIQLRWRFTIYSTEKKLKAWRCWAPNRSPSILLPVACPAVPLPSWSL